MRSARIRPPRDPILLFLLIAAFLLSALWAFSTPIPIGSNDAGWGNFHPDEGSHIAVVEYTANHRALPPYRSPYDTSVHPPLYHSGAAAIIDGLMRPLWGRANALRTVRLFSALLGTGVVYFTYVAGCATAGRRTGLLSAALVLLVPMRASLAGGITNENMAALGAAGSLAVLAIGLRQGFPPQRLFALAFWTVIGTGSKITCFGLLPAEALILWWAAGRHGEKGFAWAVRFGSILLAVGATVGWWFVRNIALYGDPFRKAAADQIWDPVQPGFAVISAQKHMAAWRYLASLLGNGWASFWGTFDGMTHRLPLMVYVLLLIVQIVAGVGLYRRLRSRPRFMAAWLPQWLAWGLLVAATLLVYLQYNWRHYTPQGRYFFVLLVPFGVLFALGWQWAFRPSLRRVATKVLIAGLVVLNLWALYVMPRRIGKTRPPAQTLPLGPSSARDTIPAKTSRNVAGSSWQWIA